MSIFEEAEAIVQGLRQADYGKPAANHERTAILLNAYIAAKSVEGSGWDGTFSAEDVCWFNVLQKISRECNLQKHDNLVDVVGYVRNIEMMRGG